MSRKLLLFGVVGALLLVLGTVWALAEDLEYVGVKKCQFCHKKQYDHWKETEHAKAFEALSAEEQKKEECLECHVTGYGKPASSTAKLEGVQCEACHGPGSQYKNPTKIMSKTKWKADPEGQRALAKEAGLILPTEEVCVGCHNERSPNFKDFSFEERIKEVRHPAE